MPLHILYGYEMFARRAALAELKSTLDADGSLATNTALFEASRVSPQEVMAACDTVPFLGPHRLVILEGALATNSGRGKRRSKKEEPAPENFGPWGVLAVYVDTVPESTTLVLVDDDVSSSDSLLMALKPRASSCQQFLPPSDKDLPGWIMARARSIGLKMDAPAARLLATLIGSATQDRDTKESHIPIVASEMDKLKAWANGDVVREGDVRELVSRAQEHKGYELSDAVADHQPSKATRVLEELLQDGANEGALLATIATKYRRMAVAREMLDARSSRSEIARKLGMNDNYGLTRLLEQVGMLDMHAIKKAYELLIQADADPKTGRMDGRLALELAVCELSSRTTQARSRSPV